MAVSLKENNFFHYGSNSTPTNNLVTAFLTCAEAIKNFRILRKKRLFQQPVTFSSSNIKIYCRQAGERGKKFQGQNSFSLNYGLVELSRTRSFKLGFSKKCTARRLFVEL
jgi:hypothetical protein